MTIAILVQMISVVCSPSMMPPSCYKGAENITECQIECYEYYTNCMVKENGKIDPKDFNACKKAWKK